MHKNSGDRLTITTDNNFETSKNIFSSVWVAFVVLPVLYIIWVILEFV